MKQEEKTDKTDNELIAEFMGVVKYGSDSIGIMYQFHDYETDELMYDTSWDWLMPVVEKIRRHKGVIAFEIIFSLGVITKVYYGNTWNTHEGNDPVKTVYESCIEFIKFYNSHPHD